MHPASPLCPDEVRLPEHLMGLMEDEEFRQELIDLARTARARMRAGPSLLANVTPEDIRRSRASALPEIIGIPPKHMRNGAQG